MNILKALWKQLFGAKHERVIKSLITCIILFLAVYTAGINMEIAASVLFLTATSLSAGAMWQAIHSSGNADRMAGLFVLQGNELFVYAGICRIYAAYYNISGAGFVLCCA